MSSSKTVKVSHLGGTDVGYKLSESYDGSKPTLVLMHSFMTSVELYQKQFADEKLTSTANLLAIELYGHGNTRTKSPHYTYWDSAIAALQALEALKITGAIYVLGTSQGGWICTRMALLRPDLIKGIIPLGTSMDYESARTRELGCWNAADVGGPILAVLTGSSGHFEMPAPICDAVIDSGFGNSVTPESRKFWTEQLQKSYAGEDGRRRALVSTINLAERDGLHLRLPDITCPVLWLHGTADTVYSVANAQEEIKMFTGSPSATVQVVEGGSHFLSSSHPVEVNAAVVEFITKANRM